MINVGELRKLIADLPDTASLPLYVHYNEVCHKYIFVRLDQVHVGQLPEGTLAPAGAEPGLTLTLSLVPADEMDEDDIEVGDDEEL